MTTIRRGLVALFAAGLLTACASGSDPDTGGGGLGDLDGRTFVATEYTEAGTTTPLVVGSEMRLQFADGSLGASAGCNSMGGAYRVDDDVLVLPDGLATTEMACDPALMDQDAWMAELLMAEPVLQLDGDALTVSSGATVVQLVDRVVARPDSSLIGTTWILDGNIEGETVSSVPQGVSATLKIMEQPDGSLQASVSDGCNSGSGSVVVDAESMSFGDRPMTLIGCDPASIASGVNAVLFGDVTYKVEGATLTIMRGDRGLVYRAAE